METPINELMKVALENIKELTEINTIVGNPISGLDALSAIPISTVKMTFATGGSEIKNNGTNPFLGGVGGSVLITPVAFLIMHKDDVSLLCINEKESLETLIPETINKIKNAIKPQDDIIISEIN